MSNADRQVQILESIRESSARMRSANRRILNVWHSLDSVLVSVYTAG